jgi:hypothetical protein
MSKSVGRWKTSMKMWEGPGEPRVSEPMAKGTSPAATAETTRQVLWRSAPIS